MGWVVGCGLWVRGCEKDHKREKAVPGFIPRNGNIWDYPTWGDPIT